MLNIVEDVGTLLSSLGYTDIYKGTMPTSPTVCTMVNATGGIVMGASPVRYPSFQILHRNTNVQSGTSIALSIQAALHKKVNLLPNFDGRILSQSEAGAFFRDESQNPVWPLNFVLTSTKQG